MDQSFRLFFFMFSSILFAKGLADSMSLLGSTVELKCPHQATSTQSLIWIKTTSLATIVYSSNDNIFLNSFPNIKRRVNITGNHNLGEYHLHISDVRKTDAGDYTCTVGSDKISVYELTVIEGPSSVAIHSKSSDNKLQGTENQDMMIICTAVDGDPAPDMVLQIRNQNFTKNKTRTIHHTIQKVDRSYDGGTVTCLAGYQSISYFPKSDTSIIYLYLKPSAPQFNPDEIIIEENKSLSGICTSSGGRPKPSVKWSIDNADITSQSTTESTHDTATDTYTVTSKLTYSVDRKYNGKNLSCGFKNTATGDGYVSQSRTLDIKFAPSVSVENKTYNPGDISRQITCNVNGNPTSYTFSQWQHKSKYGTIIRMLDENSTLTLPQVSQETRYQDTGEYVCTVSNGIQDKGGNVNQQPSGYVVSLAPPIFLSGDQQTKLGQTKNDVTILVDVYSEPKYTTMAWLKGRSVISSSKKYTMTTVSDVMKDTFHGTEVQVESYKLTLAIHNLDEQDFVNYTLGLANGVGQAVEHLVILLSASPPEVPVNFTQIGVTESTITLQWLPAYDGGHEQTFTVEYRTPGSSNWVKTRVPSHASKDYLQVYTVSGLQAGTFYELRVYAENKYNTSKATDIVVVSTLSLCKSQSCAVTGVAIGLSTITVISLIINGVLTCILLTGKKSSSTKSSSNVNSTDKENFTEIYYNITEDKDIGENSTMKEHCYEAMGTKDTPKEYDIINLKSADGWCEMTGQHYKTLGTKDKRNAYEEVEDRFNDSKSKLYSNTLI